MLLSKVSETPLRAVAARSIRRETPERNVFMDLALEAGDAPDEKGVSMKTDVVREQIRHDPGS